VHIAEFTQTESMQIVLAVHMWPHAPQFAPLEVRSTHAPLQSVRPGAHEHVPP
jgi:hypothetical protein